MALQQLADLVDLPDLVGGEAAYGSASIALACDDARANEECQPLARLVPRCSKTGRQFLLELLPWNQIPEDDLSFDGTGDLYLVGSTFPDALSVPLTGANVMSLSKGACVICVPSGGQLCRQFKGPL